MKMIRANRNDVLVLTDQGRVSKAIEVTAAENGWHVAPMGDLGQALRGIRFCRPRVVLICVGTERLGQTVKLIGQLHQRCSDVPLIAIGNDTDSMEVERAIRQAGVLQYLPMDNRRDQNALLETLARLNIGPAPPDDLGPVPSYRSERT